MPAASDSSRKKSKHTRKKQKRDNLLNRVAMTLQYISGTYKERKRKQNENKDRSCCYTISPLPFMTFLQTMKVFKDY